MIKAEYKTKVFTENGYLDADGFTSVVFFNYGADIAYLFNDVKIEQDEDHAIINKETVQIDGNIPVTFADGSTDKKVVAFMTYYRHE